MAISIFLIALTLFCWFMGIVGIKGVDWILISGYTTLPKGERAKAKEEFDTIAMNKYLAKRIFFPFAILLTLYVIFSFVVELPLAHPQYLDIAFGIFALLATASSIRAAIVILGDRFRK